MAWYRTGTIQGASGSTSVTGTGTNFIDTAAGVNAGDMLIVGTSIYEIAGVNSGTSLTLATPLTTDIASGTAYQIAISVSMSNNSLAKKVAAALDRILQSIADWVTILTGTGTVTIKPYGSDTQYSGLAWPTLTQQVQNALSVNTTPLTTVNAYLTNGYYLVASGAAGAPVTSGTGTLAVFRYSTTGIVQEWTSASTSAGASATGGRKYIRYGSVSGSTVTWDANWSEMISSANASSGFQTLVAARTAANAWTDLGIAFGTSQGQFAQGNDTRLTTVNNKTGGTVTSGLTVNGDVNPTGSITAGGSVNIAGTFKSTTTGYGFTKDKAGTSSSKNLIMLGYLSDNQYSIYDISVDSNDVYTRLYTQNGSGGSMFYFGAGGTGQSKSGWTTYSDRRLKTEVVKIEEALDKIDKLSGYTYTKFGLRQTGVIAQEVMAVLPEAVTLTGFPVDLPEGGQIAGALSLSPGDLVGLLIEGIKELRAEVKLLKDKIEPPAQTEVSAE